MDDDGNAPPPAPERPAPASPRVLGQLLIASGAITEDELRAALAEQPTCRERLGEVLVRRGTDPEAVARALATQLRLTFVPGPLDADPEALRLVHSALAVRLRAVPLELRDGTVRIAMSDPLDAAAIDDLQFQTGKRVEPVVATPAAIERALGAGYGEDAVHRLLDRLGPGRAPAPEGRASDEVDSLRRASEAPPVVALVELVLGRAVASGASDVHIEPTGKGLRVRARVDGRMRVLLELPPHIGAAMVSRIKIMGGLDIATKRRPQDGRGSVAVQRRTVGLRVSTLPAIDGEKVVMRLLEPGNAGLSLDQVGLGGRVRRRLRRLLLRSHGAVLVTGPTGSGKTTTLYAVMGELDRLGGNVVTLEDPVEYRLDDLTQVQVEARAGLTFASALRAVLRQDPDVVMVGELRDRETVEVGLAAAMTGHLVLSTLHTNDAASAVARLGEMGAPPYVVAGGLIGVIGQRLVRRLCSHCRARKALDPADREVLGLPAGTPPAYAAVGCVRCDGTGYRGRVGVFELLEVNASVREGILRGLGADALRDRARSAGMVPMSHDAWSKVRTGLTSFEEVKPLLALLADEAPLCPACAAPVRGEFLVCPACRRSLRVRCGCGTAIERGWRWCPGCGAESPTAGEEGDGARSAAGPGAAEPPAADLRLPAPQSLAAVGAMRA